MVICGGGAALLACLVLSFAGCANPGLTSIQITPSTQTLTSSGETVQFTAAGIYTQGNHPAVTKDVTSLVTWKSSDVNVATINSTGLATAVGQGTTTITAAMPGFNGQISATATIAVAATPSLTSLSIIPISATVGHANETEQFIAIGSLKGQAGVLTDMTDQVTWSSSDVRVATINAAGLATALNSGTTTITALAKNPDGSVLTTTSTFSLVPDGGGTTLPTLTVYMVGANASNGTVTGAVMGSTTNAINCSSTTPSQCTGHFPLGSTVVLTANPGLPSFGGWSGPCSPPPTSPGNPPQCTVQNMTDNVTVGAIFN